MLQAVLHGAIPVIDATYAADGGASAKDCVDPVAFYREGSEVFPFKAPFVFVESWAQLPDQLTAYSWGNEAAVAAKQREVKEYGDALFAHVRNAALAPVIAVDAGQPVPTKTTCVETAADDVQRRQQLESTEWHSNFVNTPSTAGAYCATYPFNNDAVYTDSCATTRAVSRPPRRPPSAPKYQHHECFKFVDD